jgi:hypothetical protein
MERIEVPWLLDCEPRLVQKEALSRSWLGINQQEGFDQPLKRESARPGHKGPALGWGHFLQMRLGKTPLCLNEFLLFERDYFFRNMIVFSPNEYKYDWVAEAKHFGVPFPFMAYESDRAFDAAHFCKKTEKYGLVVNYEALKTDNCKALLHLIIGKHTYVVADESIKVKNRESQATKAAMELIKRAGVTRASTGKPIVQGPQDVYSQLRFCRGLEGMNFFQFRHHVCKMGGFMGRQYKGVSNVELLKEYMDTCSWYTKRSQWGHVQEVDYMLYKLSITPKQKHHYDEMNREFMTTLGDDTVTADIIISKIMKMQQISSGFMMGENGTAIPILPPGEIPKMIKLKELLEDEIDSKVVVVYHYAYSGDALLKELEKYNPAVIRGSIWMKKNMKDVITEKYKFNNNPTCRVIVCQSTAAKYGHTLIGQPLDRCEYTIFYENNYNLDDRAQVEQRNQAVDQDWSCSIIDMIGTATEEKIVRALQRKEDLSRTVLEYRRDGR